MGSLDKNRYGNHDDGAAYISESVFHHRLDAIEERLSSLVGGLQFLVPTHHEPDSEQYVPDIVGFPINVDGLSRAQLGKAARQIYRSRRKRDALMPSHLFGEPAWDLLLDLFASTCEGRRISVTSACVASSVPSTTALRWIGILIDAGMVVRSGDQKDGRRTFVNLTPKGYSMMAEYIRNCLNI
ncbi:winged helix DNA-binding protein [Novosphingobium sp. BL-8H]|uniref:winged helix DNA-binding protein n=1 Tax=Novosphingobium sp. BL-8H TaxID=3127640 RepID=UPI003757A952